MKWLAVAVLGFLAFALFMFATIAGADAEGRGGNIVLGALVGCVLCIVGAMYVVAHF